MTTAIETTATETTDQACRPPTGPTAVTVSGDKLEWAIKAVLPHVAARTSAAPSLANVRFELAPEGLTVVATDRFTLAAARVAVDTDQRATVMIDPTDAKKIARMLHEAPVAEASVGVSESSIRFSTITDCITTTVVDEMFPNWRRLVADEDARNDYPAAWKAFNPALLTRFKSAVQSKDDVATLRFGPKNKPIIVTAPDFVGMIMPARKEEPDVVDWATVSADAS